VGFANAQKVRAPVEQALDAAADSPALLEALDCLRVAITMYDAGQRLTYANQHYDYLFRSLPQRDALIGARYDEIVRLEIEGGEIGAEALAGGIDAFVAQRRAQLSSGDFRPFEMLLADGRVIEIKARRTRDGGAIALWSDISQARNTMNRLEDAIALSADAFAFFDRGDRLVVCNQEFAALYGQPLERMRGTVFRDLLADAVTRGRVRIDGDRQAWIERRLDLHNAPAGAMTLEMSNGAAYLVRDRRTRDGRVTVLTDITDERRAEAALAEQGHALERTRAELAQTQHDARNQATYLADLTRRLDVASASADTTKKTLLRTMSHELKTPLNAIIGFSDLLGQMADRFDAGQVREYATLIHAGGHNLLRLINQILDLTKIAAGRFELRRERLDVGGALWAAKDSYGERAAAKNIAIDVEACPSGLVAEVDEHAFGQMVTQLMNNAVAFAPHGSTIRLSAEAAGGLVSLRIADSGPGVAAEDLARILEPFEQVGRSTIDHTHGAGLGLTLTKAFAELHGGSLSIESAPGQGFAAAIALPAAQ
jgi:signal transduction histidine kinase